MGSKNLQYEVLVLPPSLLNDGENTAPIANTTPSVNTNTNIPLPVVPPEQIQYETRVQRFQCSQENLQRFWIPEGFHPVLVPVRDLHVAQQKHRALSNEFSRPQSSSNNAVLRHHNHVTRNAAPSNMVLATERNRRQRHRNTAVLGTSSQIRNARPLAPIQVNAIDIYHRQKRKELGALETMANQQGDIPSKTVMEMWHTEPEEVKRKYRRMAMRHQIELNLSNNPRRPLRSHSSLTRPNNFLSSTTNNKTANYFDVTTMASASSSAMISPVENGQSPMPDVFNASNKHVFSHVNTNLNLANGSNNRENMMKENLCMQHNTNQATQQRRFYVPNGISYAPQRSVATREDTTSSSESEEDSDDAFFTRQSHQRAYHHSTSSNNDRYADDSDAYYFESPASSPATSPGLSATQLSINGNEDESMTDSNFTL
jgi:hypothetical protein